MPQRIVSYPTAFSGDYRANFYRPTEVTLARRLISNARSILELPNNSELGFFWAYSLDCCSWDSWLQAIQPLPFGSWAYRISPNGRCPFHKLQSGDVYSITKLIFYRNTICTAKCLERTAELESATFGLGSRCSTD